LPALLLPYPISSPALFSTQLAKHEHKGLFKLPISFFQKMKVRKEQVLALLLQNMLGNLEKKNTITLT